MQRLDRNQMAWRAAQDIQEGMLVNLGLGIPVLASNYLPEGRDVFFQSENGVIGVGPEAPANEADANLVDAGSRRITLRDGASVIDSTWSFAMIRGGHIDVTILGGFEVAANGDLANWDSRMPDKGPLVGGAMDLAASAKAVWVIMEHTTKDFRPRLLERCTLPLTAVQCVTRVYTDLAVVAVGPGGFTVESMVEGMTRDALQERTAAKLAFAADCTMLRAPRLAA